MAPGQFPLATGGLGIRPGATMTSVIRPGIQLQTISSLPVHGGQTKVRDKLLFICTVKGFNEPGLTVIISLLCSLCNIIFIIASQLIHS